MKKIYLSIDLKSFYASVECVERGLDPLKTNLVVADAERTEKTICLAVSPSLKKYGISGRARLFEVIQQVRKINEKRAAYAGRNLKEESYNDDELKKDLQKAVGYIVAPPRMAHYIEYSTRIHEIYLKYVAPEDIHVYSIDEVFIDATPYLRTYGMTPREFAKMIISDILHSTGITATGGIGTNLYLAKVAMDILAKHINADQDGARIAALDEQRYRKLLWSHRPITDFWRVGRGYARRLQEIGLFTMGDIAKCSVGSQAQFYNEELLYKTFGVNAELLIDHAWGYEPCTIKDIKSYRPASNSIGSGQVLERPYTYYEAEIVAKEMAEQLSLELFSKRVVTKQLAFSVGYDRENISRENDMITDQYGRKIPRPTHGTIKLSRYTSASSILRAGVEQFFKDKVSRTMSIRRLNLTAINVISENEADKTEENEQLNLFIDYDALDEEKEKQNKALEKERKLQEAEIKIKQKYGKNAVLKGMDLLEEATAKKRNNSIGGHKA